MSPKLGSIRHIAQDLTVDNGEDVASDQYIVLAPIDLLGEGTYGHLTEGLFTGLLGHVHSMRLHLDYRTVD